MKLIDRIKTAWKRRSVQLNTLGLGILTWVSIDPSAALIVLNLMPDSVRDRLPGHWLTIVSLPLYALALIALIVKKPAPEANQ